jgi:uncharacterized protein CbrC (UPF0167 family)
MVDRPYFRFHPKSYDDGGFIFSKQKCDVCSKPCILEYAGGIYVAGDEPRCCARCIHSGGLTSYLHGKGRFFAKKRDYALQDIEFSDPEIDSNLKDEILLRTPSVASVNPFTWPVISSKPTIYLGRGDDDELWQKPEIQAAMAQYVLVELGDEDHTGPQAHIMVFKHFFEDQYAFAIDFC